MFLKKVDGVIGSFLARMWPRPKPVMGALPSDSRLLLIRPGGIGDAVLLVPAIGRLREVFPLARIEVLAEQRNRGAFALCPDIDQVLCYDSPRELWAALSSGYDVVIDSEQWHRLSALVARMIRSKMKIGYGTNERKRLFTHSVDYSHNSYELNSFFALLKPLGIEPPATTHFPFLTIPAEDQEAADTLLGTFLVKPFVVLFPGASIPERCWGAEKFHQLALGLNEDGYPVVVIGGKDDHAVGEAIVSGVDGLNLAGQTSLVGSAVVINKAALLVSGDSGMLHIGVGLGKPTVSLFGSGIAAKWAPRGEGHVVLNKNLPCSPCTKFGYTPPCPIDTQCLREIAVDEVLDAVLSLLQ